MEMIGHAASSTNFATTVRKKRLATLGGCMAIEVGRRVEGPRVAHVEHLWRRPTIPLMSLAPRRSPFLDAKYPPELARYWQDDFRKAHLEDVLKVEADALLFDVTRDIWCTIYEIDDYSYVVDPMSLRDIVWHGDHPTDADFMAVATKAAGDRVPRRMSFRDPAYFDVWKECFDAFAKMATSRFGTVVLAKFYFTNVQASVNNLGVDDCFHVDAVNAFLDEAYEHVRIRHPAIEFVCVPRKALMTGSEVAWGGPSYTHYQGEAISLFAERVLDVLLGSVHASGSLFVDCALERSKHHEDLKRAHSELRLENERLVERCEGLQERCRYLEAEQARLLEGLRGVDDVSEVAEETRELSVGRRSAPPPSRTLVSEKR